MTESESGVLPLHYTSVSLHKLLYHKKLKCQVQKTKNIINFTAAVQDILSGIFQERSATQEAFQNRNHQGISWKVLN